jgi:beta-lactamase superfamily II metal-dependent hydrolase
MNWTIIKRNTLLLTISLFICLIFTIPAFAAPTVHLDGKQLTFDVPPMIENSRTLVPLRAIFEAMGATVSWDQSTQTATAIKNDTTVVLQIGSTSPVINGQIKQLDVPAKIVNGRTLAPLRFVGEAFGGSVSWDSNTQTITISSTGTVVTSSGQIKVHYINVGQADSIYIQLPDHNDILIDGGNVDDGPTVVNYLKAQGVDDIELMIATHPHEDHIGGLPAVIEAFAVAEIIDSGQTADSNIYSLYASDAKAEGCTWLADNYQTLYWGNVALQILSGSQTWQDINDYSVITKLDCGNIEFLFEGDAETPVENTLTSGIDAEILKVGHHGSTSSSSVSFLSRVAPEVAVISVGAGNTYGHPAAETLTKLQNVGATIYRTDLNGNIVVSTDGNTYSVSTDKASAATTTLTPTPSTTTSTQPSQSTGKYVGSNKSNKYHLPSCRYAGSIAAENQIWFSSEAEATAAGYVPCGVCCGK